MMLSDVLQNRLNCSLTSFFKGSLPFQHYHSGKDQLILSSSEKQICEARSNVIDPTRVDALYYLGNYTRCLPISMARMMENAHDWEHLPYVHASSFSSIDLITSGPWGWRAKIGLPNSVGGYQLLDLLVDAPRNYWVSTVFFGPGAGTEIHTQATQVSDDQIKIDVRFYLPEKPADLQVSEYVLEYLTDQYCGLYDEDIQLMARRQSALNDKRIWRNGQLENDAVLVGLLGGLDTLKVHIVETSTGRFCVRHWRGDWIVHTAVCPHLLGPLDQSVIDETGTIVCPWHGYRFNVETGANQDGQCPALQTPPQIRLKDGYLYLVFAKP